MFAPVEPTPADLARLESLPDAELVRLLKTGHDDALGVLLRRHSDALYRFCCHLMSNRDDAEDIAQETMARAIIRADAIQSGSAFRSWLFSIARNLSVDSYRARKRLTSLPDDDCSPIMLYEDSPYERVETHEEYQTVAEALGKLAKSHQTVLMMREVEGMTYVEIAQRLDVSQSAVETLLFRARRRLREEYTKSSSPFPAFTLVGSLRSLLTRAWGPWTGGSSVAAKVAAGVLVAGAVVSAPRVLPLALGSHAAPSHISASTITGGHIGANARTPNGVVSLSANPGRTGHSTQTIATLGSARKHAGVRGVKARPLAVHPNKHGAGSYPSRTLAVGPSRHHTRVQVSSNYTGRAGKHGTAGRFGAGQSVPTGIGKSQPTGPGGHGNTGSSRSSPTPGLVTASRAPRVGGAHAGQGQGVHRGASDRKPHSPIAANGTHAGATSVVPGVGQKAQATVQKGVGIVAGAQATVAAVQGPIQATVASIATQAQPTVTAVVRQVSGVSGSVPSTIRPVPTVSVPISVPKPPTVAPTAVVKVATPSVKVPTPGVKTPTPSIKVPTPPLPHVP